MNCRFKHHQHRIYTYANYYNYPTMIGGVVCNVNNESIVLYLSISIALLTARVFQKRSRPQQLKRKSSNQIVTEIRSKSVREKDGEL